jgi:predicted secreted protein
MNWFTGTMVFVVVWWTVIFAVLPWGNRPPEKIEPGHATSAPAKPRLALKFAVTTLLAAVIWVAIDQAVRHGLVSFRE